MTVSSNDNVSNKTDAENSVEQINSVDEANTSEIISSENEIKRTETVNGIGFKSILKDVDVMYILSIIWIVGVCAMVVYALVSYIRLRRLVDDAVLLRDNIYHRSSVLV